MREYAITIYYYMIIESYYAFFAIEAKRIFQKSVKIETTPSQLRAISYRTCATFT